MIQAKPSERWKLHQCSMACCKVNHASCADVSKRTNIIPEDVFLYLLHNAFCSRTRWLCFKQRKITPRSNCSPVGLAVGQGLLHDTWCWCTISSALLFLPAFLAVAEPSCSNATMMVISGSLSRRLSTPADGRVLIQLASWACVSFAVNSPGKYVKTCLKRSLRDNCQWAFPTAALRPLYQVPICMLWRRLPFNIAFAVEKP